MNMNNIKTIENLRKVGGEYFIFFYSRRSKFNLDYFTNQFKWNDYWCYKSTRNQRYISELEFQDFKYSGYIFFRKNLYNKDYIDMWINYIRNIGGINYLDKPLPPFNPNTKIIIIK